MFSDTPLFQFICSVHYFYMVSDEQMTNQHSEITRIPAGAEREIGGRE
jgi:hypothetical protein